MKNSTWKNWQEFRTEAYRLLRGGAKLNYNCKKQLKICFFPSFGNPQSWEILTKLDAAEDESPFIRKYTIIMCTWRMDLDYPDIDAPDYSGPDIDDSNFQTYVLQQLPAEPTIEKKMVHDTSSINTIMDEMKNLSLSPYFSIFEVVEDSASYETSFGSESTECSFRWTIPGPPEWNGLYQSTDRMIASLNLSLSQDSA